MNRFALAVALTTAGSLSSAATFTDEGEVRRACGGVGVEDRAEMRALRIKANLELLFVQGKRGGYAADVSVRIAGAGRPPFTFPAEAWDGIRATDEERKSGRE